ncbi:unnamed protein product, partial [Candidula unifasciata]
AVPAFKEFHFLTEPLSTVAVDGKPARFDCVVQYSGPEKPLIRWIRHEDQKRLEDTSRRHMLSNGSLHFSSVVSSASGESDEGHYQCTATVSGIGTIVSRRAQLKIAHLPKHFEAEPGDLHLAPGDTAAFECLIHGEPKPTITWFKGTQKLVPGPHMKVYPTGLLEIGPLSSSDYGTYACEAEVPGKSRKSRMATLALASANDARLRGHPKFIIMPHSERVVKGETVFLHCVAYGRDGDGRPPIISWLKDGSTIVTGKNSSRIQVIGSGTLLISDVLESDAGVYTCRAVNLEDSVDADAALTVLVPPVFTEQPTNKFAHTQSDVTLECEAHGIPRPVITWVRNGDVLKPSDYFKILSKGSLKILGLVNSDDGMYQCVAENELGDAQASAQLVVLSEAGALYSESHSKAPTPVNLRAVLVSTRFVMLSWDLPDLQGMKDVTSYSVFWREAGSERERVSNTTLQEFNIQSLKPKTEYEIRVRAYNSQGPSQREAKITVLTKEEVLVPSPPINLKATALSSNSIAVTWDPPVESKGVVELYVLIYYKVGSKSEDEIRVKETFYTLKNLQQFREYSFRVLAVNENGRGQSTAEVTARTFSAIPTAPPQNFTLEVSSSTSLIVRWQPPPQDFQNGIITGYKIRLRRKGYRDKEGDTKVTDGNRNTYALTDLRKGTEYQVRIAATTVNGTGPFTSWETATTYQDDLDESTVPPEPAHLIARPKANSIKVSWAPPPPHSKILVRGYVLGYGRGISDVYKHTLDANTHDYVIENLQPASHYVITIRAFNSQGQGPSKYETVITSEDTIEEPATPMLPPVGLNAHVLSSSTIILTWADNSLSKNQKITDNRYYTIRYRPAGSKGTKYRFINATDLNYHIEGLRPNTEYEFMVKVIKGRRESDFSMTVYNKTEEAAPSTEPRDVTPVPNGDNLLAVSLSWQPPARPNGLITEYLIYYTNELFTDDMTWPVEVVVGDELTTVIDKLTPDTVYHFKVQARNSKGLSPKSAAAVYKTPPAAKTDTSGGEGDAGLTTNAMIIIGACVAGFIFCTLVIITIVCLCRCRGNNYSHQMKTQTKINKTLPPSVKPPDLWIHQPNNLELQKMERSQRSESSASVATSTLRRGSRGSADQTDDQASTLDRRRNSFVGDGGYPSSGEERYQPIQPRNLIRPKPVALPDAQASFREPIATVTAAPNGHILQYGDSPSGPLPMRPIYPRTQYNTQYTSAARVNAGDLPHTCPPSSKVLPAVDEDEDSNCDMVTGMDESYNSRIGYVKPQQSISPYKKPTAPVMTATSKGQRTPISFNSKSPELKSKKDEADLSKSLSTEELTAEMANLEGLMKDLNAITQQEFEC